VTENDVIKRLEAAGKTLMALPDKGYSPALAQRRHEIIRKLFHDEPLPPRVSVAMPDELDVMAMEIAYGWVVRFIPVEQAEMRRVVHMRSLVHPISNRHICGWRKIGRIMRCDYKTVQSLHSRGIKKIFLGASQNPQKTA
jgi:hypothetical protein